MDDIIRKLTDESDLTFGSELYEAIHRELTDLGLNLAFFVFTTSEHSSCARTLNGKTSSYPVITLYLKYDDDFKQTAIDPHRGNWDDKWSLTQAVRDIVNAILRHQGCSDAFVSDHTFVFVRSLEKLALREVGRACKDAVRKLVIAKAPDVTITDVFWNGQRFDVILRDKADLKRVKGSVKTKVARAIPGLLASADKDGNCQSYEATIEFAHSGMNLFHLKREDL